MSQIPSSLHRLALALLLPAVLAAPAAAQVLPLPTPGALVWGQEVRTVGDLNLDGFPELAIGAPGGALRAGLVDILDGAAPTAPPLLTVLAPPGLAPGDRFGRAIASGDVNGDGFPELLVSAPFAPIPGAPSATGLVMAFDGMALTAVILGIVPPLTPTLLWTKCAPPGVSRFGLAIDTGDVDGNGSVDVVIGAPASESVYVVYPSSPFTPHPSTAVFEPPTALTIVQPLPPPAGFGRAVDVGGDLTGDGVADIAVGAPAAYGMGVVLTYQVNAAATPQSLTPLNGTPGLAPGDRFGFALDIVPDLDGDGLMDLLIGAPGTGPAAPGGARLLNGGTLLDIFPPLAGPVPGGLGGAVTGIGDRTGDGIPDLVAGAPFARDPVSGTGGVLLISGATGLAVPPPGLAPLIFGSAVGLPAGSLGLGFALDAVGITPSGIPLLLVGAPGSTTLPGAAALL